jgi:Uncharacterised nucleotidyltransferase
VLTHTDHPQVERQLILLSAGTAVRRRAMREQALRLMSEVNWSRLAETLRPRRLLPTLGPRILELAEGGASNDFAAAVEQATATGRRQGVFLQLVSKRLMAALADAGIRSTALKGPLLSEAIYGDPGRRLSSDIDLLVATEQLPAAVEVVRQLGYDVPTDYVQDCGLPMLHFALPHEHGKLPQVELHWRIHWYEESFARERLLPPAMNLSGDWRPAPADELTALLLFYARDGFVDLRLAADLSAWWDTFGAKVQPEAFDELLRAYAAFRRIIPVAAKVAEQVVGLPATQIISDMPKPDVRDRIAMRLADPNPRASRHQLYAYMGLIDGLLMPPGGFGAFMRRKVVLPREVLEEYARHPPGGRVKSPLGFSLRILVRYLLALTQVVRGPDKLWEDDKLTEDSFVVSHGQQARQIDQDTPSHTC